MKLQDIKEKISDNKYLIIVSALALVLLCVIRYLLKHKYSYVAVDITEVNNLSAQLVSVLSLIIVSAVSIGVGVSSNKKNSERQKLDRKMEAFDKLNTYLPSTLKITGIFNKRINDNINKTIKLTHQIENEGISDRLLLEKDKNEESNKPILEEVKFIYNDTFHLHLQLTFFPARYSHLFKNNYKSDNYNKALSSSEYMKKSLENLIIKLEGLDVEMHELEDSNPDIVFDVVKFTEELKKELI